MPFQHFDDENPSHLERMTDDERRAVIARWQEQRGFAPSDAASLPDVAEGLDISVAEAARLLQEVRAERIEEQKRLSTEKARLAEEERRIEDERAALRSVQQQRAQVRAKTTMLRMRRRQDKFGKAAFLLIAFAALSVLLAVTVGWTVLFAVLAFSKAPKGVEDLMIELFLLAVDAGLWALNWHMWKSLWKEFRRR